MKSTPVMKSVQIDERTFQVKPGWTIMQAAEANQIYIPHLCAHKDLLPFGGCRLCLVEVAGMRNFAPACTTPVEDGMVVLTSTPEVNSLRKEILKLILSEHPSNCLFCKEGKHCAIYMDTLRKVASVTGCRACPDDGQCELQEVVEYLGVTRVEFPAIYRDYPVEDYDPFYDRDYNLCILCGRCIGACQQYRLADVLTFKHRGHQTLVGVAFDRTHIEAGCEFCGSCVTICPTGTLAEKTRKWEGKPERQVQTTCPFCGLGCQIQLLVKGKEVMGSLPVDDSTSEIGQTINHGQLCLKGRFAVYETLNHQKRLTIPYRLDRGIRQVFSWDQALNLAAEKLFKCAPNDFAMLVSADCTNEELYLAQKFTRSAMRSANVDTDCRGFYGASFNVYLDLLRTSAPLSRLEKARVILSVGLDARYNRSVVGVEIKKALKNGAKLVTIHPREHNLALHADTWIRPEEGGEAKLLRQLLRSLDRPPQGGRGRKQTSSAALSQVEQVAGLLRKESRVVILVGSEYYHHSDSSKIFEALRELAVRLDADLITLPAQANLVGSIQMGCYPELLPGGYSAKDQEPRAALQALWGTEIPKPGSWNSLSAPRKLKVLYLVGTLPPPDCSDLAEFIIYQNSSAFEGLLSPAEASPEQALVLPSAAFSEMDGSFTSGEGRIQPVNRAVEPPGWALPGWEILSRLAAVMGKPGFDFSRVSQVRKEIRQTLGDPGGFRVPSRKPAPLAAEGRLKQPKPAPTQARDGWRLYAYPDENTYQGVPLSTWVGGMQMLFDDQHVEIHPEDARELGISEEDFLLLSGKNFKLERRARLSDALPPKTLFIPTLRVSETLRISQENGLPISVSVRKKDV